MTNPRSALAFPHRTPSLRRTAAARLLLPVALALAAASPLASAQTLRTAPTLQMPSIGANTAGVTRPADYIVAVVNSEPITNNEVRVKMLRTEQQMLQQGVSLPSRTEMLRQVLERMISDKAQLQVARSAGIKVDENSVENAVQAVARQNNITVEELRRRLRTDGIVYSQFESEIRDELMVSRMRQREVDARVTITERDVDQFIQEQGSTTTAGNLVVNLGEILIAVPENATPAQVATLQAKANLVAERARKGDDFTALSNEFSESPTRAAGGLMGLRQAERYPPLFLEATLDTRPGGIAGPVRSGAGFHVLKVVEKRQADMPAASVTQTHARHILLRLTPSLPEAAAIAKLAEFKRRIAAGQADFAALARESSDDASAKDGGDLGWANPGMFVPEFEKVMGALAPGQVSDPLVSRFGVHLIQVMERREQQLSDREQREVARNMLREKKQDEAYQLWAQEIRGRAYVEFRDPPV